MPSRDIMITLAVIITLGYVIFLAGVLTGRHELRRELADKEGKQSWRTKDRACTHGLPE